MPVSLRLLALTLASLCAASMNVRTSSAADLTQTSIADLEKAMDNHTLTAQRLTKLYLARIKAYDKHGPSINAVITLNPAALDTARALDSERRAKGPRGPLHGLPVILKDNYNTADLQTTGGSFLLAGSLPPKDAFLVKKLRDAGAIILAKVNLSEFASGGTHSSMGGQTLNPHDLSRTPSGSSGGTGAGIAAVFAPLGMGTDTGGSIRGPATANGIVGLKPTLGLLSRAGIIPLSLSFDTGGPLALNVSDIATALGVLTGVDPDDVVTQKSVGHFETDYTRYLRTDALKGAHIGIARDFLGQDPEVDWIVEAALEVMRKQGATVVDVRYPKWLLASKEEFYNVIRRPEFVVQIGQYLQTLKPGYPRTFDDLIEHSNALISPRDGFTPNESRWALFKDEQSSGSLSNPQYLAVRDHGLPLVRAAVEGVITSNQLDAIVYPTSSRRPARIDADPPHSAAPPEPSATNIANLTGFPDLIVPAGFTSGGLPVGMSFFGPAFSEPKLLALGFAFEQATRARRLPVNTPALPGERFNE